MAKFFEGVCTIEELKKEYKVLAKKYHPDLNKETDTNKIMSEINNEYERLFAMLKDGKTDKQGHNVNGQYRNVVSEIVKFEDVTIDVIGSWIWLYGKGTFAIKEKVKELGFKWSSGNKKWYWTETPTEKKRRKSMSYDYKVQKFGVETLKGKGEKTYQLT